MKRLLFINSFGGRLKPKEVLVEVIGSMHAKIC